MRTIFLLVYKAGYGSERKVLRAFQNKADAEDIFKLVDDITHGTIEVQEVDFVGTTAKLPEGWRPSTPQILAGFSVAPNMEPDEGFVYTPVGMMAP